jgi:PDZ domain-containing secreted protein
MRKSIVLVLVVVALAVSAGVIFAQDTATSAKAWLGVAVVESDSQVTIARVQTGSPADAANLLINDVIVSFNGTEITSASGLVEAVQAAAPGDTVTVEVQRNGEPVSVEVTLTSTPTSGRDALASADPLTVAQIILHADLSAVDGGFEVTNVLSSRNPFELQVGDVVTAINDQAITELDVQALHTAMRNAQSSTVTLSVTRAGESITLDVDMLGGRGMGMHGHGMGGRGQRGGQGFGGRDGMPFGGQGFGPGQGQGNSTVPQDTTPVVSGGQA